MIKSISPKKQLIYLLVLVLTLLCVSCHKGNEGNNAEALKTILKDELNTNTLDKKKIYIIQYNSCSMCFENLKNELNSIDTNNVHAIYVSRTSTDTDISFLGLDKFPKTQIIQSNNKELTKLLLEAVGSISKAFYYVEVLDNGNLKVEAKE